jgi:hypothetical protein
VLDIAFGFFVWALHLLVIYGAGALACVLGLASAEPEAGRWLRLGLGGVTVLLALVVAGHALARWRGAGAEPDRRFRAYAAASGDAIALVAIVWQAFPIALAPVCT